MQPCPLAENGVCKR